MMIDKNVKDLVDFATSGLVLTYITAWNLLEDKDIKLEEWQTLENTYDELVLALKTYSDILPPQMLSNINLFGRLARVATACYLEEAVENLKQIPEDLEFGLPQLLGEAIVAKRRAEHQQDQPAEQFEFARKLYALSPCAKTMESFALAQQRVLEVLRYSLELFAKQQDLSNAISAASLFVGLANELAFKYSTGDYINQALQWGEKILLVNIPPTTETGPELCALTNNLANTCNWLILHSPSDPRTYCEKGLAFATLFRNAVEVSMGASITFESYILQQEQCISVFVILHTNIAIKMPDQFSMHADTAWKYLQEYDALAHEYADVNLKRRASELKQKIYRRLQKVRPEWIAPNVGLEDPSLPDPQFFDEYTEQRLEQARAAADEITSLTDFEAQLDLTAKFLDSWYTELTSWFSVVLSEMGLNHQACRLILVLGAVANGRLGDLVITGKVAIFAWVFHSEDDSSLPDYTRAIERRQQFSAIYHFIEETQLLAAMIGIAEFTRLVQQHPALAKLVPQLLRDHNALLLRSVLSQNTLVQRLNYKLQTTVDDLALLLRGFSDQAKMLALESYAEG